VARSARDAAAALFVNGLPVAVVFGVAFLLNFTLDVGTVLVAALVLGMAVDPTFHALRATPRGGGLHARLRAHERVAEAAAVSTMAVALGFLSLVVSEFQPIARFGLLCSIGVASSLLAYLLVWPALWVRAGTSGS
jgi:predicted RND superfamily exporter protein